MRGCTCHSFGPSGAFRFKIFFYKDQDVIVKCGLFIFFSFSVSFCFFAIYIVHDKTNLAGKFNDHAIICDSDLNS